MSNTKVSFFVIDVNSVKFKVSVVIGLTMGLASLGGCERAEKPALELDVYIDVSNQGKARIGLYLERAFRLQESLSTESKIRISTFSSTINRVYLGSPVRERSKFFQLVYKATDDQARERNTRLERVFQDIAEQNNLSQNRSNFVILTDGAMEIQSERVEKAIQSSLKCINTKSQIVMAGLEPKYRKEWEARLQRSKATALVLGEENLNKAVELNTVRGEEKK